MGFWSIAVGRSSSVYGHRNEIGGCLVSQDTYYVMIRDRAPRSSLRVEVGLLLPVGSRLKDFRRRHLVAAAVAVAAAVVAVERIGQIYFRQRGSVSSADYFVAAGPRAGRRDFRRSYWGHCWLETGRRGSLSLL